MDNTDPGKGKGKEPIRSEHSPEVDERAGDTNQDTGADAPPTTARYIITSRGLGTFGVEAPQEREEPFIPESSRDAPKKTKRASTRTAAGTSGAVNERSNIPHGDYMPFDPSLMTGAHGLPTSSAPPASRAIRHSTDFGDLPQHPVAPRPQPTYPQVPIYQQGYQQPDQGYQGHAQSYNQQQYQGYQQEQPQGYHQQQQQQQRQGYQQQRQGSQQYNQGYQHYPQGPLSNAPSGLAPTYPARPAAPYSPIVDPAIALTHPRNTASTPAQTMPPAAGPSTTATPAGTSARTTTRRRPSRRKTEESEEDAKITHQYPPYQPPPQ